MHAAATIAELVTIFAESTIAQDQARTAREMNRHARKYIASFQELVSQYGDEGREALTGLFEHPDAGVRCMAAAFLIRYCTKRATAVLTELAAGRGMPALGAQCTLQNWADGSWELDLIDSPVQPPR